MLEENNQRRTLLIHVIYTQNEDALIQLLKEKGCDIEKKSERQYSVTFPEETTKRSQYMKGVSHNPKRYYLVLPDGHTVFVAEQDEGWCYLFITP